MLALNFVMMARREVGMGVLLTVLPLKLVMNVPDGEFLVTLCVVMAADNGMRSQTLLLLPKHTKVLNTLDIL